MSAAVFPIDFTLLQRFAPVIIAFIVFFAIFGAERRVPLRTIVKNGYFAIEVLILNKMTVMNT